MARSLNKAMIIGHVGQDPDVRSTSSGTRVANISIATNTEWTGRDGQKQERTEWHRAVFWDKAAEIIEKYVSKGDRIYVEGRIEYRQWEGNDGQTRYTTEIRVREFVLLGGNGRGGQRAPSRNGGGQQAQPAAVGQDDGDFDFEDAGDDLPF